MPLLFKKEEAFFIGYKNRLTRDPKLASPKKAPCLLKQGAFFLLTAIQSAHTRTSFSGIISPACGIHPQAGKTAQELIQT